MAKPHPGDLTKVHVEFQGNIFDLDAGADAHIDSDLEGLNQNLVAHPGKIARWAFVETKIREIVEGLENRLELMDAELFTMIPARIEKEGKKATVDTIKSYVILDPSRQALQAQLLVRSHELNLIIAGRQTMLAKKDCLLALASNMRAEMDHGLHVAKRRHRGEQPQPQTITDSPGWE